MSRNLPPQQNLWVRFGSGRRPRLCKRASFATFAVRNPYDFLVTSFTLLLSPRAVSQDVISSLKADPSSVQPPTDSAGEPVFRPAFKSTEIGVFLFSG
jgi:hypothetical protein